MFKIKSRLNGPTLDRQEPCNFCGHTKATLICPIDYWDLQSSNIVQCLNCHNSQLDPMLTQTSMNLGCLAYYLHERQQMSAREQHRNKVRNFRRGVVFASKLKSLHINPQSVLEVGPGSGYFSSGVNSILKDSKFHVVDIVDAVLEENRITHGFHPIKCSVEDMHSIVNQQFDLVIARDVIEHVSDVKKFTNEIWRILKPGGHFHFITPTGLTDFWPFYQLWQKHQKTAELLINHVNYFEGQALHSFLEQNAFRKVEYYSYGLKSLRRGKGWSLNHQSPAPESKKRSAKKLIEGCKASSTGNDITTDMAFYQKSPLLLKLWSQLKREDKVQLHPQYNLGEQLYGLYQKVPSSKLPLDTTPTGY